MVSIKNYYSDVILKDDENKQVKCCNCEKIFPTWDILLDVTDDDSCEDDYDEYCPFCNTKGCLMDLDDV